MNKFDLITLLSGNKHAPGTTSLVETIDYLNDNFSLDERLRLCLTVAKEEFHGHPIFAMLEDMPHQHDLDAQDLVQLTTYLIHSAQGKSQQEIDQVIALSSKLIEGYEGYEYGYIVSETLFNCSDMPFASSVISGQNPYCTSLISLIEKESVAYFHPEIHRHAFYDYFDNVNESTDLFSAWIRKAPLRDARDYLRRMVSSFNRNTGKPIDQDRLKYVEIIFDKIGEGNAINIIANLALSEDLSRSGALAELTAHFIDTQLPSAINNNTYLQTRIKIASHLINEIQDERLSIYKSLAIGQYASVFNHINKSGVEAFHTLIKEQGDNYSAILDDLVLRISGAEHDPISASEFISWLLAPEQAIDYSPLTSPMMNLVEMLKFVNVKDIARIAPDLTDEAVLSLRELKANEEAPQISKAFKKSRHKLISSEFGL